MVVPEVCRHYLGKRFSQRAGSDDHGMATKRCSNKIVIFHHGYKEITLTIKMVNSRLTAGQDCVFVGSCFQK